MARVTLTKSSSPGPNPTAGVAVTMTAADTTNFEQFTLTGREVLIVHNTGGSSYTYTITSTADPYGSNTRSSFVCWHRARCELF